MADRDAVPIEEESFGRGVESARMAEWLALEFNRSWRYDHAAKRWHHWTGIRWAPDDTNDVFHAIADAARAAIDRETWAVGGKDLGEMGVKALTTMYSVKPNQNAQLALASRPEVGTNGDDWDSDPFTLGVLNGLVDLRTNTLTTTPASSCNVTKTTGVNFIPATDATEFEARAPRFMQVMHEWTSDDPAMVAFLLLWFGSSMFGFSPEQRFLLMTGIGRNGKGALKHAIMRAVGEYGAQFDANLYMRSKQGGTPSSHARADLLALKGKRITFFSEPEGNRFNEELLKAHTGGDQIVARALYSNVTQTWDPTHSITFLVNDAPEVEDLGPSMAARVMVADFRERFDGDKEDKNLYTALEKESEGILAILCWAAAAWYRSWSSGGGGITLPERVQEQSRQFMERNDPVAQFIEDSCDTGAGLTSRGQLMYDAYMDWYKHCGRDEEQMSTVKLAVALAKKGFRKDRDMHGILWKNIKPKSVMDIHYNDDTDGGTA